MTFVVLLLAAASLWGACGEGDAARNQQRPPPRAAAATRTPAARAAAPTELRAATPRRIGTGAWSYFGDPRAVYAGGRTFVGWTDTQGYVNVASLRRNRVLEHQRLGPRLVVDDHDSPALYVRPDGRIMVFYSEHNGRAMYYRVSARRHSISRMSPPRTIGTNRRGWGGYTYPNPVRVDGALWLMFRGADWQPDFTISVRGRWTRARTLVRGPVARKGLKDVGPGRGTAPTRSTRATATTSTAPSPRAASTTSRTRSTTRNSTAPGSGPRPAAWQLKRL